jgi:hypothetical protein
LHRFTDPFKLELLNPPPVPGVAESTPIVSAPPPTTVKPFEMTKEEELELAELLDSD